MLENVSVGYALGMVEGYLEGKIAALSDTNAETVLEYLKAIENAYIQKNQECLQHEAKLRNIGLNLDGWSKN